jgi:transposase
MGRHLAQRLVADGETVLDVPAKLAARARVFSTGQGRKTDATDAHAVAVVALRTRSLRQVRPDDRTVALRLLVDRRDERGAARTLTINRLHRLLVELVPGGAKKALTARQARALLAAVPAGDVVRETRRQLAGELVDELEVIDARIKTAKKQLAALVAETGSGLMRLNGIGPSGAARLLGDIGDVSRFPSKAHFASWNGTAPLDASSGEQTRHRLSRAGNRRINRALHIMAVVQLRHPNTEGRRYYDRRVAEGKTPMEAMRALKRRLSDVVYRQLVNDHKQQQPVGEQDPQAERTGPEGHLGAATKSSAAGSNPNTGASDKSVRHEVAWCEWIYWMEGPVWTVWSRASARSPSPPRRALRVTAGCEARGEAQGHSFHPGVTGEGKTGRVNASEPSMTSRDRKLRKMECAAECRACRWDAAVAAGRGFPAVWAPTPVVSHPCGTWEPRRGPAPRRCW